MHRRRPQPPTAALAAGALAVLLVVCAQERPPECGPTHIDDWNRTDTGTNDYWGVMGQDCSEAMADCLPKCKTTLQRVRCAGRLRAERGRPHAALMQACPPSASSLRCLRPFITPALNLPHCSWATTARLPSRDNRGRECCPAS